MDKLQDIFYQPNNLWKGWQTIRKLRKRSKEKPKVIKKYKYILSGINVTSRYKVARPLRTKQAKDAADMIADIYKVGPLTYPKIFQCDSGREFKAEVTKMLEKHEVHIRRTTTKYKHTHTARSSEQDTRKEVV